MAKYSFFDVETPNRQNNRICSIGIEQTDSCGNLEYSQHFFVNPEQGFDSFNMDIHGISPSMVLGAPTFPELWESNIAPALTNAIVVAHNAVFDLTVLGKTLDFYGIRKPDILFHDTLDLLKHYEYESLRDYKLPTACEHFGISQTSHHDALADARACREVFWAISREHDLTLLKSSTWMWVDYDPCSQKASSCNSMLTDLYGIALGIRADEVIRPDETKGLLDWMERNEQYRRTKFMDTAFEMLERIVQHECMSFADQERLLSFARPFVLEGGKSDLTVKTQAVIGALRGISCDGRINEVEAAVLSEWLDDIKIEGNSSIDALKLTLAKVLEDGIVDPVEEQELLRMFSRIIDPVTTASTENDADEVAFEGKRFVLSGNFTHGSKSDIETMIVERGGEVSGSVSGKVSYVVVGGEGSEAYACGSYGSKVKKAMALQDQGKPIRIIEESQLGFW